jgi:UDP-N-acetylmuramyl tripeptide synthase
MRSVGRGVSSYDRACIAVGRAAGSVSRLAGRGAGGTLPGRITLLLRPRLLEALSADRRVVLVSGTNGKSTTTRLLTAALSLQGPVLSNRDGANLLSGITGALMNDTASRTAVLEVDEVVLPAAVTRCAAAAVVLTNLSRDQLDRVEEVTSHVRRWGAALLACPDAHIVANADDPLVVAAVRAARPDDAGVSWVAAGSPWRADATLCPRCGEAWSLESEPWSCEHCGLRRPDCAWQLGPDRELIGPQGLRMPMDLALPGRASAADAVLAAAAAAALGVQPVDAVRSFREVSDVDGRYLQAQYAGRPVQLLLAKNPAGWLEALSEIGATDSGILLGINARTADGTDPSWLWDVPFERLQGRNIVVFGDRALDLSVRLHYAEVQHVVAADVQSGLAGLAGVPVQIAANYTAFLAARARLRAGDA